MNYINLPSGTSINLDQVAFIEKKANEFRIVFAATYSGAGRAAPMEITVNPADCPACAEALGRKGITFL